MVLSNPIDSNAETYVAQYLSEVQAIAARLDQGIIQRLVDALVDVRSRGGRLFIVGVGGSAANAKQLIEAGKYRPVIDRRYPLTDVVEATRYVETEQKTGNVVLTVSQPIGRS